MNNLSVVREKETTFMGYDSLVRFTDTGAIKSQEVEVELSYRSNHFWKLETSKWNSVTRENDVTTVYKMTAEGYEELNKAAGLKVLSEPTFNLNGDTFTNPAIIVDDTGRKNTVYYKTTLYGYGPDGEIHFSSTLIHYNATDELISSILSKIKWQSSDKSKVTPMGQMMDDTAFKTYKETCPYAIFIPTDDFGGIKLGIAVDVSRKEFLELRYAHQDKINNLEKKIQTVAKRNAYRKHPATAVYSINPEKKFDAEGKFIDLIAKIRVVRWMECDPEKESLAIQKYTDTVDVEVEDFKDIDADKDEEVIDDTIVEVDAMNTPFDNERYED